MINRKSFRSITATAITALMVFAFHQNAWAQLTKLKTEKCEVADSLEAGIISTNKLFVTGETQFDSLHVLKTVKVGNSIVIAGFTNNEIYTDNTAPTDLLIQSNTGFPNHNTILNANNTTGKVGIGTNNPQAKFHLFESDNPLCGARMRLEYLSTAIPNGCPGSSIWDIISAGSNTLEFITPSIATPVMIMNGFGSVGIGTTTPPQTMKLEVKGSISLLGENGDRSLFFGREQSGLQPPATNLGEWGIQYLSAASTGTGTGGLNFWKPTGSHGGFGNYFIFLADNGGVGVGTNNPTAKLHVLNPTSTGLTVTTQHANDYGFGIISEVNRNFTKAIAVTNNASGGAQTFVVYGDGRVGIGGADPDGDLTYKLVVCGAIRTKKVVVETFTCDFVFDENYPLSSLKQRKDIILKNKHLINVPSAKEMDKNGNDLGNTTMGILQNVEEHELFLYQHDEQIQQLKEENKLLKQTLEGQQKVIEELKKIVYNK